MVRFNNFCEKLWSNMPQAISEHFIQAIQSCVAKNKETDLKNYCKQIEKAYEITSNDDILGLLVQSLCDNKDYSRCQRIVNSCPKPSTKYKMLCLLCVKSGDEDGMLLNVQLLSKTEAHFSEMLKFIHDKFSLSMLNVKRFYAICKTISNKTDYEDYVDSINLYAKRLVDNKMYSDAKDLGDLFSDFYDFDISLRCTILHQQNDLEEFFYTACSNLSVLKKFYPYGQWLVECAKKLDKENELLSIISNYDKDCTVISRTITSLQENLGIRSKRLYKYKGNVNLKNNLDVVFCLNNDYFQGFKAAIKSCKISNRALIKNFHFNISIDNSVNEQELFNFLLHEVDCRFSVINIEKEYDLKNLKINYGLQSDYVLDKSAYYRIFTFDYLIKNNLHSGKILYLDSDVLVLSDFLDLFSMHMEYPLYAVPEIQTELSVEKSKESNKISTYFNSGVLLVNANDPTTPKLISNCIDVLKKESNLFLHDQCALNIVYNNNFGILPSRYNQFMHGEDVSLSGDICILHFSGRIKPWESIYHGDEFKSRLWYTYYKANL